LPGKVPIVEAINRRRKKFRAGAVERVVVLIIIDADNQSYPQHVDSFSLPNRGAEEIAE